MTQPFKVFRVVEVDGGGIGAEIKQIAVFRDKQTAQQLRNKSAYYSIFEAFAIQVDNQFYILKSDKPVELVG